MNLVDDVLHAVGGVEYVAHRVLGELDEAGRQVAEYRRATPQAFTGGAPQYWSLARGLPWDYPSLVTWLRTVKERIDRLAEKA